MQTVAVIAEYNPFHNGHAYHLRALREKTGSDTVIAIMSGNFVQRGEPAVADKYTRTAWALHNGADMVLELPVYYALSNAQFFAEGAVKTLAATGIVHFLGFGAGVYDIDTLYASIKYKDTNSDAFHAALKRHLDEGKSYPRAAYAALTDLNAPEYVKATLNEPNSILGVEYIRAINRSEAPITPVLINRIGCGHDSGDIYTDENGIKYASASYIRNSILSKETVNDLVPNGIANDIAALPLPDHDKLSALVIYALRSMDIDDIKKLPDVGEGLYSSLYEASRRCADMNALLECLKTKRYTLARLKRILMCALLHLNAEHLNMKPSYIRVLGIRKDRRELLSNLSSNSKLPVILSARDTNSLDTHAYDMFEHDCFASDVYSAICGSKPHTDYERPLLTI